MGSNSLLATNSINYVDDSSLIFKKIKENEKKFKLQKSKLFAKREENDYVIRYSVDKKSTRITTIHLEKKISDSETENRFYWFNEGLLFKITTTISTYTKLGIRHSRQQGFYFFFNDLLFYKEERNISKDVNLLLIDKNKYLIAGNKILNERL